MQGHTYTTLFYQMFMTKEVLSKILVNDYSCFYVVGNSTRHHILTGEICLILVIPDR